MNQHLLIGLAAVIGLGIGAQWLSWRLRLPSILLLLACGFVAGPLTGLLRPDAMFGDVLLPLVSLAVAVILFEGGLSLRVADLREIGPVIRNLMTIGVLVAWMLGALGAHYLAGLSWPLSALIGAVLVVTGPTVILPLLRQVRPAGSIGHIVKWEGIVNDPIGAILAVLVFEAVLTGGLSKATGAAGGLAATLLWGAGIGALGAGVLFLVLRFRAAPDFLQSPIALMVVVATFVCANVGWHESGLLAVTLMGIILANQRRVTVKRIIEFKENLRVLLISSLFILLAARLNLEQLTQFDVGSLLFLAFLIVVARPATAFLSTVGCGLSWQERLFLAWMAPRGIVAAAVTSVFAIELEHAGFDGASQLVPLVFLVIVGTVLCYGLTAAPLARMLGLAQADPQGVLILGAHDICIQIGRTLKERGIKVLLLDTNWTRVRAARMAGIEAHCGSGMAEGIADELDLDGIGRLLAMTPNDEANSLSALHFAEVFGSAEVYQLPPASVEKDDDDLFSPMHLRGRFLFASAASASYLADRVQNGSVVKATELTETFDYAAFTELYGPTALPLFCISPQEGLLVVNTDDPPGLQSNQVLISLVDAPEKAE